MTFCLFSFGTEMSRPPEVCASARRSWVTIDMLFVVMWGSAVERFFLVPPGTISLAMSDRT